MEGKRPLSTTGCAKFCSSFVALYVAASTFGEVRCHYTKAIPG
jgi:hypothetical protein